MYKNCQNEQSFRRQRQIETALMEMMCHRRYEDITVSELCSRTGIPRKAFYRYFSSKDGAMYAMIDHTLMDLMEYIQFSGVDARNDPCMYMEKLCTFWKAQKPLMEALAHCNMSGNLVIRAIDLSRGTDSAPQFLKTAEKQLQDYGSMFATCGIMTMMIQWHQDGHSQSVEQMAKLLLKLLSQPLFLLGE